MALHTLPAAATADALVDRIRREYRAQGAMRLTLPQASRLFALEPSVCRSLLDRLVAAHELIVAPDGAYQRCDLMLPPRIRFGNAPALLRR